MTDSFPPFGGIHHLNLTVTDPDRSADWYVDVLGFERGWQMPDVEGRGRKVVLTHPHEPFRLVLTGHSAGSGDQFSEFRTGLDHFALSVPDRSVLEAWVERLDKQGVAHSEIKEGATGWLITFRDPDNVQLELYTLTK